MNRVVPEPSLIGADLFSVRPLSSIEIDHVARAAAPAIGLAIDRYARVRDAGVEIPETFRVAVGSEMLAAFSCALPKLIAFGCDEPSQEKGAAALPAGTALPLAAKIIDLTIQQHGIDALMSKIAAMVSKNSHFHEFIEPWIREQIAVRLPNKPSRNRAVRRARELN